MRTVRTLFNGLGTRAAQAKDLKVGVESEIVYSVDISLAGTIADSAMMSRGIGMADFECRHGRLPGDEGEGCLCFGEGQRTT